MCMCMCMCMPYLPPTEVHLLGRSETRCRPLARTRPSARVSASRAPWCSRQMACRSQPSAGTSGCSHAGCSGPAHCPSAVAEPRLGTSLDLVQSKARQGSNSSRADSDGVRASCGVHRTELSSLLWTALLSDSPDAPHSTSAPWQSSRSDVLWSARFAQQRVTSSP